MGKPNPETLKEIFRQAAEIASAVPESMHDAAFNRALDQLMGEAGVDSKPTKGKAGSTKRQPPAAKDSARLNIDQINRTKYAQVTSALSVLDRSLWVLKMAHDDFEVDGLTPTEIAEVLTKKFRVATSMAQVSDKLGKAGSYVDRRKGDRGGYVYFLMDAGDKHLEDEDGKSVGGSPSRKRKASRRRKAVPKTDVAAKKTKTKSRGAFGKHGRPGPRKMIETLLSEGFFDSARIMAEIVKHAQTKLAHTYKPTDLSPALIRVVRDKKLDRSKNQDGQYEYTAKTR